MMTRVRYARPRHVIDERGALLARYARASELRLMTPFYGNRCSAARQMRYARARRNACGTVYLF